MKKYLKATVLFLICTVLVGLLFVQSVTVFAAAENITSAGTPIASVDRGNLSVIVDGNMPEPVYSGGDTAWSADTWGAKEENAEDYFGIQFQENYVFTEFIFQEGCHFDDGGWFTTYRIEVLQGDTWVEADVTNDPEYPEDEDGTRVPYGDNFEIYTFELTAIEGSAIRIIGLPGGSGKFVSCSELEVYKSVPSEEPGADDDQGSDDNQSSDNNQGSDDNQSSDNNQGSDDNQGSDEQPPVTGDVSAVLAFLATGIAALGGLKLKRK